MRTHNPFCCLLAITLVAMVALTSHAAEQAKPELAKWIDARFEQHFASQGLELRTVDDATFQRRAYLDLSGRIPMVAEIRDFTKDKDPQKRVKLIDDLITQERFDLHTARVWRRILMPPGSAQNPVLAEERAERLDTWLQTQFKEGAKYDQIARRLVTAGGADEASAEAIKKEVDALSEDGNQIRFGMAELTSSPVDYLQHTGGQPASMASSVSRVFLGVRLECAQCHDHPFTDWTQQDFWGVAAFFAGARLNPQRMQADGAQIARISAPMDSRQETVSDEDGNSYGLSLPWDAVDKISVPQEELPRQYFAKWMTSTDNPHFAATAVNRVWQQLCGRGLTESVDDLDQADPEERKVVLDDLAVKFAESGFDLKRLVRAICTSDYYQRSSEKQATEKQATEKQTPGGLATRPLKVMTPEQLFDSFEIAVAMPISSIDRGPRYNGEMDVLVDRMEEAIGDRPDDFRSGIPQALTLMNGKTTADATDLKRSRMLRAVVDAPFLDMPEKVDTLFLATLGRTAYEAERAKLMEYINDRPSEQEKATAFSEVMWALINSEEFVLVR